MAQNGLEIHISFRKFLLVVLLALLPPSLAGLYSLIHADRELETTIGGHFRTIAESSSAEVSQFVHDRVLDVGLIAAGAVVNDAAAAANRAYDGLSDAAIAARIEKIDKEWNTPAAEAQSAAILTSAASRTLRRFRDIDRRFLRISVTDAKGATIAATHKTIDYFQADEEYWQGIYAGGRGAISLTDVLYDEVTKSSYIGIGVPILDESSNRFLGTVDALVDVSSLYPIMHRVQIGRSSRMLLVKNDGTVIAGPRSTLAMKLKSDEHAALLDAVSQFGGQQSGYLTATLESAGRSLIGFSDTGLKRDYQQLDWVVLVSQDTREAFAPIRLAGRLIAFMSLLGLATITFAAAYVAMHRKRPLADIGAVPHEPVQAPGEPAVSEDRFDTAAPRER